MLNIELRAIHSGYDRKTCWVHPRAGAVPGAGRDGRPAVVLTMQKLLLSGSDVFYALNEMRTDDLGQTWSGPVEHPQLGRRREADGIEVCISDFTPKWHAASGKLLGVGHNVRYRGDRIMPDPRPRETAYSVYDPAARTWMPWDVLPMPDADKFFCSGAGCVQRVDLPDGTILLPVYFRSRRSKGGDPHAATILRCAFDGSRLTYIEHGNEMVVPSGRGLCEPSLASFQGRFYLTLRNDHRGYVTSGADGLHFGEPRPWTFDDGSDLGNYNTQQHWVTMPDALYLAYTRRGANNDHVFRHRAPLFIAEVDSERLCVIRKSERVLVPERGARLGNFGVAEIGERESWVTVAEWMQTNPPNPYDSTVCERYGSDNSVFVAKVLS